jgi:hypothetical protein
VSTHEAGTTLAESKIKIISIPAADVRPSSPKRFVDSCCAACPSGTKDKFPGSHRVRMT